MDKGIAHSRLRKGVQILNAFVSNAHLTGFVTGKIYSGALKGFCVPGMNCYSCPGALGACPIGSMQAVFDRKKGGFPFAVVGYLSLIGLFIGRFICGWLCVFGLIQELLYKVPVPKVTVSQKADRLLRYFKYAALILFVILLPLILRDEFGMGAPFFCKWICPVGMLEGGIPLLLLNKGLRPLAHGLYTWKFVILLVTVGASLVIQRPFCKYLCPLGAFYSLFQKVSVLKLRFADQACIHCGACARICPMQVDPTHDPNSRECIRCGDCIRQCPAKALKFTFREKDVSSKRKEGLTI